MPSSRGIFPIQILNLPLLPSLALAGRFFTTSATWEAQHPSTMASVNSGGQDDGVSKVQVESCGPSAL